MKISEIIVNISMIFNTCLSYYMVDNYYKDKMEDNFLALTIWFYFNFLLGILVLFLYFFS